MGSVCQPLPGALHQHPEEGSCATIDISAPVDAAHHELLGLEVAAAMKGKLLAASLGPCAQAQSTKHAMELDALA
eukprot:CAMPEP_0180545042 /NCGR_PEP_ID=MMETSP1036_2-20121128/69829_1 /TAXON_ID=632150 /ORGANISM="Azadinium spinosum, Strain 3D9" /LENGTH=74 /DNA_ID=CAMNT_0022560059 /DNA_START=94 /DNA_END=315 /DNA_ORIENTATION=-